MKDGGVLHISAVRRCSPSAMMGCRSSPNACPADKQNAPAHTLAVPGYLLTPSVPHPNKRSKWLLGKPLCSSACRLCPYNIMLRLPSSQSPSRLCRHLTHSSRSLFPCLELFLPPARKINQCLTLPVNARELLVLEGRNGLPVPHPRPPALPHLSCH